ncbi:MAG TPA: hypothetical protein ENI87_12220 [bacterium]|nr:hypothetical protein [bacterium]
MRHLRSLSFAAATLAAVSFSILQGHAILARVLVDLLLRHGAPAPMRLATVAASLAVHLAAGIWVLPGLLRLRRRHLSARAARICVRTSLVLMFLRTGFEALSGVSLVGLPTLGMAATLAGMVLLCPGPTVRRARGALHRLRAGSRVSAPLASRVRPRAHGAGGREWLHEGAWTSVSRRSVTPASSFTTRGRCSPPTRG